MSIRENIISVALRLSGGGTFDTLAKSAAELRSKLDQLPAALAKGDVTADQFTRTAAKLSGELSRQEKLMGELGAAAAAQAAALEAAEPKVYDFADSYDVLERAETHVVTSARAAGEAIETSTAKAAAGHTRLATAAAKAGDGTQKARQGIVDISRAAQDFAQGGFPAIVNNLEGIGRGLPAIFEKPAEILKSIPALATLAGVGILVLGPPVLKLVQDFAAFVNGADTATGSLARLQTRIKELEETPHLIPLEIAELENARKEVEAIRDALAEVKALGKTQAGYEKKSGAGVAEAIAESSDDGGKHLGAAAVTSKLQADLAKQLVDAIRPEFEKEQAEIRARIEELRKDPTVGVGKDSPAEYEFNQKRAELEESKARQTARAAAITDGKVDNGVYTPGEAEKQLGDILAKAKKGQGDEQRAAQEALVARLKGAGFGKLAGEVEDSAPANVKAQEAGQERSEARQKQAERQKEIDTKKKAEDAQALQLKRNVAAGHDKELADAVSEARQTFGDDLKQTSLDELASGGDRDKLKATLKKQLKALLDKAGDVREPIRDAVAEEVVDKVVRNVTNVDVNKAVAGGETKAGRAKKKDAADAKAKETAAAKDRTDLASALGEDFLADAARARMELYFNPEADKRDAARFRAKLHALAVEKLRAAGHDEAAVSRLAGGAAGLVDSDVQQRAHQARADAGAPNAPIDAAMRQALQGLNFQRANRPRPNPQAAPRPMRRKGKPGAAPTPDAAKAAPKLTPVERGRAFRQAQADAMKARQDKKKADAAARKGGGKGKPAGKEDDAAGQAVSAAGAGVDNTRRLIGVAAGHGEQLAAVIAGHGELRSAIEGLVRQNSQNSRSQQRIGRS
jgi:hypothetical protein